MTRSNTVATVSHHLKGNPASLNNSNRNISLTQQQYDEYSRYLKATEWDTFNMVIDSRTCDPMTNIVINGTEIRVMVDTGPAANAINEQIYNTMDPKPPLKQLKLPHYVFDNPDKPLKTLGYFSTRLRWRTNQSGAQIVVMKGNSHQNLIGRHTAVELGMVSLNLGQADLNQIGQKLHGKLGCVINTEVKLEIDKSIIPVKQPLRPITFHYREAVEKELDIQNAEGILEKGDYHDTPHSATGIAPNMLLYGYARTSGLPIIDSNYDVRQKYHRMAQEQHNKYAEQMKRQFDMKMKARECPTQVGDILLGRQSTSSKSDSALDPHPFTVTSMKSSMIEATRCYPQVRKVAMNSSFFKLYREWSISDENTANTIPVTLTTARESTPRPTQTSSAEQETKGVLTTRSQPCSAPTVELEESGAEATEPASSTNTAPETRTRSMEAIKMASRPNGRPMSEEYDKLVQ
ncbi:RNA-directed DNA polymerase [Brachionus plicatilis]|uniref:RNA-directed DNA polymerase n=1 Tax=Brachionus plicatilis TaxID=10195 RepID=A0A3M7PRM4_BRAPC|nr:RNA-directed DNA polymerase [Brachionus plicatilis]